MDLYNTEYVLQDLNKSAAENEVSLTTTLPLEELQLAKYKAETLAYDEAIAYLEESGDLEAVKLLQSERVQVDALYKDASKKSPF